MSIFTKALREESETIKFDNLFTQDIEREQEFDLVFAAEQDDEDLKSIAGNSIMKEDGTEIEFNLPDCVSINEDGEVVDKDEEEEEGKDISSNDVDDNGVDDDLEAADKEQPAGPSVVVNVDADDVNINAADDKVAVGEDGDVTVNANVANITPAPAVAEPVAPSAEPVASPAPEAPAPAPCEGPECDEVTPIEDDKTVEVDKIEVQAPAPETPAEEPASDSTELEPISDEELTTDNSNDEPAVPEDEACKEDATEELLSADMLDDISTAPTSMENQPVDPSTEVVFSDNPDIEVRNDDGVNEMTLIEEDLGDITLGDAPQEDSEIEEVEEPLHTDTSAYAAIEKEEQLDGDEAMTTIDDLEIDQIGEGFEDEEIKSEELGIIDLEGMEPSLTSGPLEDIFMSSDDDPSKKKPAGKVNEGAEEDTAEEKSPSESEDDGEETKDECGKACKESDLSLIEEDGFSDEEMGEDDTNELEGNDYEDEGITEIEESDVSTALKNDDNIKQAQKPQSDFEDNLSFITQNELEKTLNSAPEDEVKDELDIDPVKVKDVNFSDSVKEAAEPSKGGEPVSEAKEPEKDNLEPISEEIEAVKNDDNLEPAGEKFEDDLSIITDGDVEKILNNAPEDETKKEEGIDPVKPSDIPMNDGSVKEAAEPSKGGEPVSEAKEPEKDNLEPISEFNLLDADEPSKGGPISEAKEPEKDNLEPIDEESAEIIDANDISENDPLSPIGPSEIIPDEINAPEEDMEYDKVAKEQIKEDYEEDLSLISTGDDFANTLNDGLDHSPEEEEPGSLDELIDNEALDIVESED